MQYIFLKESVISRFIRLWSQHMYLNSGREWSKYLLYILRSILCCWSGAVAADWGVASLSISGGSVLYRLYVSLSIPSQQTFANPTMHLCHIPQCTMQNRNVHISVLNGALWDMEQVHCGICEIGLFQTTIPNVLYGIETINLTVASIFQTHDFICYLFWSQHNSNVLTFNLTQSHHNSKITTEWEEFGMCLFSDNNSNISTLLYFNYIAITMVGIHLVPHCWCL